MTRAWLIGVAVALGAACGSDDKPSPPYTPPPRAARPLPEAAPPAIDASEPENELSTRQCVTACKKQNRREGLDIDCIAECEAKCLELCLRRASRRGDPSPAIERECDEGCTIRR